MNAMRPISVCDTTPLQRLESQSSCSEPSSPTLNAIGSSAVVTVGMCAAAVGVAATKPPTNNYVAVATVSTTAVTTANTVATSNGNPTNGSYVVGVNGFVATGGGSGMSTTASTTTTASTASTTALSSLGSHSNTSNNIVGINNNNNNNDKTEKSLNIFINTGGIGGPNGLGGSQKLKMELYGTRKICSRILLDFAILACGK